MNEEDNLKRTILLIHGIGANNKVWTKYKKFFLSEGFNVLSPSLRYHDRKDCPIELGNISLLDYLSDLESLIKHLDTPPIIIGHSMGALLTLKLMEKDLGIMGICLTPAAPRGINAISPSVIRIFLKNLLVWKFWEKVHAPRFSSFYLGTLGQLSMTEAKEIFDEISAYESGRVGLELGFPIFDPRRASEINEAKIKRPILVVGATKDRVTPIGIARKISKKLSHVSDYKEFSDFGHWLMSGKEFSHVSQFCLDWLQKQIEMNKNSSKPMS